MWIWTFFRAGSYRSITPRFTVLVLTYLVHSPEHSSCLACSRLPVEFGSVSAYPWHRQCAEPYRRSGWSARSHTWLRGEFGWHQHARSGTPYGEEYRRTVVTNQMVRLIYVRNAYATFRKGYSHCSARRDRLRRAKFPDNFGCVHFGPPDVVPRIHRSYVSPAGRYEGHPSYLGGRSWSC